MIEILVDTHTHTNCSHHAYSTLCENIAAAKERGLEMICMTNHAPAIPDSAHIWHFRTMQRLPRVIDGVKLLTGAEANLIDKEGNLDLPIEDQKDMDLLIASIHGPCYKRGTIQEHTNTYLGAIKNPYVTIIGHSGNPSFAYDIDTVIVAAREHNKCIEINNNSYVARPRNAETCKKIALACKKHGTKIVVSSDAHSCFEVGNFKRALEMLEEIDFPQELIMNTTAKKFGEYLEELKLSRQS